MINNEYFNLFGGTALGIDIAKSLSENIAKVTLPPYDVIPVKKLLLMDYSLLGIKNTINKKVLFKFSGKNEDFSFKSARGINTSRYNPVFVVNPENFKNFIFNNSDLTEKAKQFKSVILQELITEGYFFIVQMFEGTIVIELLFENKKIIILTQVGKRRIVIESSGGKDLILKLKKEINIEEFIDLQISISNIVPFSINTEGFISSDNQVKLVQLRPTPNDVKVDSINIPKKVNYKTFFTFGIFNIKSKIINIEDKNLLNSDCNIVIVNNDDIPWENNDIKNIILSKEVVFLKRTNGFKLSHSPKDIPPFGLIRDRYNYVFIGNYMIDETKFYEVLGNGNVAIIRQL